MLERDSRDLGKCPGCPEMVALGVAGGDVEVGYTILLGTWWIEKPQSISVKTNMVAGFQDETDSGAKRETSPSLGNG